MSYCETHALAVGYSAPLLRDIALQAERGSILALIGPNGAGKSTHCMSRPISCPACQGRPQAESLAGRWGRVLARCGVGTAACYPHCWYALFKEQRRGRYFPLSLSSRKRGWVNTLTPQIFQNIFSCPAGSGPCA